jgi:hypothetical protein
MKIRIKGNSVRFRLTKKEVATFCSEGVLTQHTEFATKTFYYQLKSKAGISQLEADYLDDTITIYFPEEETKTWASSNRVGYHNEVDWNDETALSLLVEKDFTCLDTTLEDQSDNYPNPRMRTT